MATKEQVKGFWFPKWRVPSATNVVADPLELPPHWIALNVELLDDGSIIIWARRNGN